MSEFNKEVGKIIIDIRRQHEFSQEDFAKKVLGISKRHLRRVEKGLVEVSINNIVKIATYFNLHVHDVLNQLDVNKEKTNIMNDLYFHLGKPNTEETLLSKIDTVRLRAEHNEFKLSEYEEKTLEMFECYILFHKHQDSHYLKYFVDNNMEFIATNIHSWRMVLPQLNPENILEKVDELEALLQDHADMRKAQFRVELYGTAIGILLHKNYKVASELERLFHLFKEAVIKSGEYYSLMVYYRHQYHYYHLTHKAKDKAKAHQQLSSLLEFTTEEIRTKIIADLQAINQL